MAAPVDRLQQLDKIERDIASVLQSSGAALLELSKDKPSVKQMESHTSNFIKTLESVENGLLKHINYLTQVSTGQPHEGSCYAAHKDLLMAYHRSEHVKSRLNELEKMKNEHMRQRQQSLPRSLSENNPHMLQRQVAFDQGMGPMQRSYSANEANF